jgi:hypothetical protein
VHEVPLVTPSGEVLGYVWHVKGSVSRAWHQEYWRWLDHLAFANYPGTGGQVIRIATKHLHNVFLLGRQNNRVLESVPLSNLEDEFLQMVSLIMNEQKKIIADYAASNQLLENPNVYWDSDMVQMTIGRILTVGFGDHYDLSVLLCDDSIWCNQPSSHLKTCGEDVQTATFTPSSAEESDAPVYVVWSTMIDNKRVELARIQTGPFDIHVQGHGLQKRSTHAVEVDIHTARQSGAIKAT